MLRFIVNIFRQIVSRFKNDTDILKKIQDIKIQYPVGARIRVSELSGNKINGYLTGTVSYIDKLGYIYVRLDSKEVIKIKVGRDKFDLRQEDRK